MVYEPAEDSELLKKEVEKNAHGTVLEIGTGSGVLALAAANRPDVKKVVAVDIDPEAVAHCKANSAHEKIEYQESDLFSEVTGKFDVIVFNPPYLPADDREDEKTALATTGGKKGYEITERFLLSAGDHMEPDGEILLLFSSLTPKKKIDEILDENLYDHEMLSNLKIAFEELYVYKITKNRLRKELEGLGLNSLKRLTKGHRGFIYTANWKGENVAVKCQRPDIDAAGTVQNEAEKLKLLNPAGIGPKLLHAGKDYFIYRFVEGEFILDLMEHADTQKKLWVLKKVLSQMRTLDIMGLNKEEMHHPLKHIVVGDAVVLLDFERCKVRKVQNVTQFVQFIVGGHMAPYIPMDDAGRERMLQLAKRYADDMDEENYLAIVNEVDLLWKS